MLLGGLVLTVCTVLAGLALWIAALNRRAIRRIEARQDAELLAERDEIARRLAAPSRGRHLRLVKPPTFAAVGAAVGAAWGLTRRHPGLALGGLAAVTASGVMLTPSYSQAPQPPAHVHGVHTAVASTSQVAAPIPAVTTPRRTQRPSSVPASTRPAPSTPVTSVPASTRKPPAVLAGTPTTTTSSTPTPASSTPLLTSAVNAVTSAVGTVTSALPPPSCRIKVLDRCVREALPTLP
jgi:hypothetical protein